MNNEVLIIVSGPSGGGKTTVMRKISDNEVVSFTTRNIRDGEIDGVHYHFISKEKYNQLLENDELAEHAPYDGEFYGIMKEEIDKRMKKGLAYAIVDFRGMKHLKKLYPNAISIFVYSTKEEALEGLKLRGESEEKIKSRISKYDEEVANKGYYDFVVRNKHGKLNEVAEIVNKIIELETKRNG